MVICIPSQIFPPRERTCFFESKDYFKKDINLFENDLRILKQDVLVVDDLPEVNKRKL